jgi:exodeoxyribonuclease VII small subunit
MASKKPENMSIEATLSELESLVEQLETGDISLEESLKQFERGIALVNASQNKLTEAEQKVQILSQSNNHELDNFELNED